MSGDPTFYWPTLMRRFSWACMPNCVALGSVEVAEKFRVVGWGVWDRVISIAKTTLPQLLLG